MKLLEIITCLERKITVRGQCLEQLYTDATATMKSRIAEALNYTGDSEFPSTKEEK